MSGRLEVRVTPDDVGKRVSVRSLTGAADGSGRFTDTLGVLTSWTGGVLRVTRRDGEVVALEQSALVAAKVVPAAPARRRGLPAAGVAELTRVADRGWPAAEREPLGEWVLRASGGFTRRANSLLPLGDPGMPLDAALERVTAWYAARGLPAYAQLSAGAADSDEELAAALAARGWVREVSADVLVGGLAPLADRAADTAPVECGRDVGPPWLLRYRGIAEPSPHVWRVLRGGPSVWFATVPGDGPDTAPAATGRCVVDGRWAGFAAVEVDPARRREGLATAVMAALARQALAEGASAAWLQAEADNEGAHALYNRLGFAAHHSYQHWRAPRG
ncbi:GNAT family N-acetyltransferase [Streptomyces sp. 549]|uniref:GNAT family N-acetyltransferase n=1 Tax=Streptomyces sp. 549 TaxID=3049076 RepID=UPI0024C42672|nr:GNAT family N-acetyltransferase [Streptomyces sp. 549]MDK1476250.1 GNAT family N-acetyltransferase [Streptomyces sp. 549]